MAASKAFSPFSILTIMDSAITIALSTSIPSAIISAARETWFKPTSALDIKSRVVTITAGIRLATTTPVLIPRNRSMTTRTTTTLCIRLLTKSFTDFSTKKSWEADLVNSIP